MKRQEHNRNTPQQRPWPPVRRRRRRRSLWPLYAVNILLLGLAAVQLIPRLLPRQGEDLLAHANASAISTDIQAPVITGVRDLTVQLGDSAVYMAQVSVSDDVDPAPALEVDSSQVDLSREGQYTLTYIARDAAGNCSYSFATVTVVPKSEDPQIQELARQEAQAVLDEILEPGMSPREQVQAIYTWAKENFTYGGHTDRRSIALGAHEMLTTRRGDCYGYFAATKVMLDCLGITNVDVEKRPRNSADSEHFWSLVSLDGGTTWYHFDATPRVGQTEELCLVTDTFLDSFDTYHDGCHNRDKSAYPATPEGWA